jgi:hypothetical protein
VAWSGVKRHGATCSRTITVGAHGALLPHARDTQILNDPFRRRSREDDLVVRRRTPQARGPGRTGARRPVAAQRAVDHCGRA